MVRGKAAPKGRKMSRHRQAGTRTGQAAKQLYKTRLVVEQETIVNSVLGNFIGRTTFAALSRKNQLELVQQVLIRKQNEIVFLTNDPGVLSELVKAVITKEKMMARRNRIMAERNRKI